MNKQTQKSIFSLESEIENKELRCQTADNIKWCYIPYCLHIYIVKKSVSYTYILQHS